MKKSNLKLSSSDNSKISQLMSSIENKLDLLAKDDFQIQQEASGQPLSIPYQVISPAKNSKLEMNDLSKSQLSVPSSPILSRLSQMQEQYLSKLTVLNQKMTFLQSQNSELKELNYSLEKELAEHRQKISILQQQQQRLLDARIEQLKESMMHRLRQEIEAEVEGYIIELKQMREEVGKQRKERKLLQKQLQLMSFQRDNFQEMYKQMMEKYKMLMHAEITHYEHDKVQKEKDENKFKDNQVNSKEKRTPIKSNDQTVNKKRKTSKKEKVDKIETTSMGKEELIPFLAKGIEELKEKLKLK